MLRIDQLEQLVLQTERDAKTAVARVGIFDEEREAALHGMAVANANAMVQFHNAVTVEFETKKAEAV